MASRLWLTSGAGPCWWCLSRMTPDFLGRAPHSSPDGIREGLQVPSYVDASLILPGHGPELRMRLTDAIAGISAS